MAKPRRMWCALGLLLAWPYVTQAEEACEPFSALSPILREDVRSIPGGAAPVLPGTPRIGEITLRRLPIFDESKPEENAPLYRLANRLHVLSRPQALRELLTFEEEGPYVAERLREAERLLRTRSWAYDARVVPTRRCADRVDVAVVTRDVWSLVPTGDVNRTGGKSSLSVGIKDVNLLGRGESLGVYYENGVDRSGVAAFYNDPFFRGSPWTLALAAADNDDGDAQSLGLLRPYRSFDDRRSEGVRLARSTRIQPLFDFGDRIATLGWRQQTGELFRSRSSGVVDGQVARWTTGLAFESHEFFPAPLGEVLRETPEPRRFAYPFLRYERLEDRWDASVNLNFVALTEDVYLGRRWGVTLGLAPSALARGGDRARLVLDLQDAARFGERWLVRGALGFQGWWRFKDEAEENWEASGNLEAFYRQSEAFAFYASLDGLWTRGLTGERQVLLGGNTGLRAYPQRFQAGDRRFRLRVEERWFSSAHPFELFRYGAAVFFDAGRAWFPDDPNSATEGTLANVGAGLRLTSDRAPTDSILHLDLAVPLRRGGEGVDDWQLSVTLRESF